MKNKCNYIYMILVFYLIMFGFETIVYADALECEAWGNTLKDLQNLFDFCKIIIPLLVIGLSSYDFIKSITGKDDKNIKKAFSTLLKRLALAVPLFFLPTILGLLLKMLGTNSKICIN